MVDGSVFKMWVHHPLAMLAVVLTEKPEFAALLLEFESPKIVMYSDEIVPGDAIRGNDRKVQCVYWSFMNFGSRLSDENLWFTLVTLRSSICKNLKSGMAQVYKALLTLFFGSPHSPDLRHGVAFSCSSGDSRLIFGHMGAFIQYEKAAKEFFQCKGARGIKHWEIWNTFDGIHSREKTQARQKVCRT